MIGRKEEKNKKKELALESIERFFDYFRPRTNGKKALEKTV